MAARPQTIYGIMASPSASPPDFSTTRMLTAGRPPRSSRLWTVRRAHGRTGTDEILDNITLYWLTNTGSLRLGSIGKTRETSSTPRASPSPCASSPSSSIERRGAGQKGPIHFNDVDKGGHFAAWEQPQLFTEELRAALHALR